MGVKIVGYRQMLQILAIFMIVQFFGLFLMTIALNGSVYTQVANSSTSSGIFSNTLGILLYAGYIVLVSALFIFLFKHFKGVIIFRILEAVVIFFSTFVVLGIIIGLFSFSNIVVLNGYINIDVLFSLIGAAILVYAKNRWGKLRNFVAIVASVGVGIALGLSFPYVYAVAFMIIIAVYDFIAVFITKHMLSLANVVQENNLAFMVGVNEYLSIPKQNLTKEQAIYAKTLKNEVNVKSIKKTSNISIPANVALGTGDLSIPLMVGISALVSSSSFINFTLSMFIAIGGTFGLILTMFILRKYKRALPAIPPLLLGVLIGIGLYYLSIKLI